MGGVFSHTYYYNYKTGKGIILSFKRIITYKILAGKISRKRVIKRLRRRQKYNIKNFSGQL